MTDTKKRHLRRKELNTFAMAEEISSLSLPTMYLSGRGLPMIMGTVIKITSMLLLTPLRH